MGESRGSLCESPQEHAYGIMGGKKTHYLSLSRLDFQWNSQEIRDESARSSSNNKLSNCCGWK